MTVMEPEALEVIFLDERLACETEQEVNCIREVKWRVIVTCCNEARIICDHHAQMYFEHRASLPDLCRCGYCYKPVSPQDYKAFRI